MSRVGGVIFRVLGSLVGLNIKTFCGKEKNGEIKDIVVRMSRSHMRATEMVCCETGQEAKKMFIMKEVEIYNREAKKLIEILG